MSLLIIQLGGTSSFRWLGFPFCGWRRHKPLSPCVFRVKLKVRVESHQKCNGNVLKGGCGPKPCKCKCIYCYRHNIFYKRLSDAFLMSVAKTNVSLVSSVSSFYSPVHRTIYRFIYIQVSCMVLVIGWAKRERKFAPLPSLSSNVPSPWRPYSSLIPSVIISLLFAVPFVSSHRRHDREAECATPFSPGCVLMFQNISWVSSTLS